MADLAPLTYGRVVGRFLAIVAAGPIQNFHTNPGFETDTSTWVATGGASISRVTTEFHSGVASLQVVTTAAPADGTAAILSGLTLGTEMYGVGFWVKAPLGAAMIADINLWNTTAGNFVAATKSFTGTGEWQWVDTPGASRTDGADQIVALVRTATGAAITFYVDDATAGDVSPEAVAPAGTITFTPTFSDFVKVTGASPTPATATLRPITVTLDGDGYLGLNSQIGVWLVATDDPVIATVFTYTVTFELTVDGLTVPIPSKVIEVPAGGTYDLSGDYSFPEATLTDSFETVSTRTNFFDAPTFASAGGLVPDGMSPYLAGGATGTRSTTGGKFSVSGVACPAGVARFGAYRFGIGVLTGATTTTPVTVAVDVEGIAGSNTNAALLVELYDGGGSPVGNMLGRTTSTGRLSVTNASWTAAPVSFIVILFVDGGAGGLVVAGGAATFSKPMIEYAATVEPYFDGSTPDAGGVVYSWLGTVNLSPSTAVSLGPVDDGGTACTVSQASDWANSGDNSIVVTPTGASTTTYAEYDTAGLVPGSFYTAVATCRLDAAQTGTPAAEARTIRARFVGSAAPAEVSPAAPNTTGEHEVRVTFQVPLDATDVMLDLWNGADAGNEIWWDDLLVVEVPSLSEPYTGPTAVYFGDSPY